MSKIQRNHLEKPAYIYIRQSTMAQVRHHQESTERQYALKDRAIDLGWREVRVLDGDLGISGSQIAGRNDFKTLVTDVSMRKAGAVFALEASRLARNSTDWHRLLELCAFTDTLIIDEDGCYSPADFNDQLLLGLKGTMSQAELHFLRGRLQGGKINKAKRGELKSPLPVGFVYDEGGRTVIDPDAEVRHAVTMLFEKFRETGSACGVVRAFVREGMQFPKRAYGGTWNGKLIWGRLSEGRVEGVLKNPAYAGAYVYGRYQSVKNIAPDGTFLTRITKAPMASWTVLIRDHHEGYISWETFGENKELLERNRTNGQILPGPAREGHALLQGLLICRSCGRRITIRYMGNGGTYPIYECNWQKREGLSTTSCIAVRCDLFDGPVVSRLLEVVEPKQIEIALKAFEELEHREATVDNQWRMKLERATYEVDLAQRRYENVDPANRLVAATLERLWNDALARANEIKKEFGAHQASRRVAVTDEQKKALLSLAQDLPSLWGSPTTQDKDRKRILRLLIKDITVERVEAKRFILHLRWQGGACEDIPVSSRPNYVDQIRYPAAVVDQVRLLAIHLTDRQIAAHLNEAGLMSAKGKSFTSSIVRCIRYAYRIPAPVLKLPGELTVDEVAEKFAVSPNVVYYWMEHHMVSARRPDGRHYYYIALDPEKEKELADLVAQSVKMHRKVNGSLNHAAGGAV
jgi:DNA invertase Pin-like site-specific DNA recombinase